MTRGGGCPRSIDKRWDPRYDARPELARRSGASREAVDGVLAALAEMVCNDPRVCVVGLGTWTRRPYHRRTPDGRHRSVTRVCFRLSAAAKREQYGSRALPRLAGRGLS